MCFGTLFRVLERRDIHVMQLQLLLCTGQAHVMAE